MAKVTKTLLSADQLQSTPPLRVEPMVVKAWDLTIHVRELRADEADIWKVINKNVESGDGFTKDNVIDLCLLSICKESGERIFTTPEHRKQLAAKEWTVLQAIYLKALAVGRMSAQGVEDEKKESNPTESSDLNID